MGRPPIGKRAMTGAERMRRHRERKFGKKDKPAARTTALLQARILELEAHQDALGAALGKLFQAMTNRSKRVQRAFADCKREFFAEFARQRRLAAPVPMVTGYQPAADRILGPASDVPASERTLNRAKAAIMAAPGKSNRLIAKEISVPEKTVRNARRNLARKSRQGAGATRH